MQDFIGLKESNTKEKNNFYFLAFLFVVIFISTFFLLVVLSNMIFATNNVSGQNMTASFLNNLDVTHNQSFINEEIIPVKIALYKNAFENINIQAKSAIVIDTTTGKILYERNKNFRMPLASLAKIMTAILSSEILNDDIIINIEQSDLAQEGNTSLSAQEKWRFKDLLDFSLITSSNDGVSAIASQAGGVLLNNSMTTSTQTQKPKEIFIEKMNEKARKLGLIQTEFFNVSGLDINLEQSGAYGTAKETAQLFEYILNTKPNLLQATTNKKAYFFSQNDIEHTAKNTNEFVELFAGLIGSKTGFTNLAGGNLGVVFDSGIGTPIIIVVLGSTIDGRFEDALKLYNASLIEVSQNVF